MPDSSDSSDTDTGGELNIFLAKIFVLVIVVKAWYDKLLMNLERKIRKISCRTPGSVQTILLKERCAL